MTILQGCHEVFLNDLKSAMMAMTILVMTLVICSQRGVGSKVTHPMYQAYIRPHAIPSTSPTIMSQPHYKYPGDHMFNEYDQTLCPQLYDDVIMDSQLPWNITNRDIKTTPGGFRVSTSSIKEISVKRGLGVFADIYIPAGVWIGTYEGDIVFKEKALHLDADYSFQIMSGKKIYMYRDAWNPRRSNWIRYINCARDMHEQNVEFLQCYDQMYYRTIKPIYPGTELMVFYGFNYIRDLDINIEDYCRWFNGTFYDAIDSTFICS